MAKPETTTRTWVMTSNGYVTCSKSKTSKCFLDILPKPSKPQPFHGEDLIQATREINSILECVAKANSDNSRKLSFLAVGDRVMLSWTQEARVSSEDDSETIRLALCETEAPSKPRE